MFLSSMEFQQRSYVCFGFVNFQLFLVFQFCRTSVFEMSVTKKFSTVLDIDLIFSYLRWSFIAFKHKQKKRLKFKSA